MLDTEFIREGSEDGRLLVYVYRSSMLKRQVLAKLEAWAQSRDQKLLALSADDLFATIAGTSLFADIGEFACDIGRLIPTGLIEAIADSDGLRVRGNGVIAILLHHENPALSDTRWNAFVERCYLITEVPCSSEYLGELTGVVSDSIGLPNRSALNTRPTQALLSVLAEESDDLLAFVIAAKAAYFAGEFEVGQFHSRSASNGRVTSALQTLILSPSRVAEYDLIGAVSAQLQHGGSEIQQCRTLVRATHSLVRHHLKAQIGKDPYANGVLSTRRLMAWTVLLTSSLQRERWGSIARYSPQPARLVPWLGALAEEYRGWCLGTAAAPEAWSDPQSWGHVATEKLRAAAAELLKHLPKHLEPQWLAALRPDPRPAPGVTEERFEVAAEIVGQRVALRDLRSRIVAKATGTPILLVGPRGIGKRTLGVHYAKASLCETPVAGTSCGTCTSCIDVANNRSWMFVPPVDVASAGEELIAEIQRMMAKGNSFAHRIAMVWLNVDRLQPDILDRLLKTIEEPGRDVTLAMTATQQTAIRVAVRSRSRTIKLRRLSTEESARFFQTRLGDVPGHLLDALLLNIGADGRGLPRTLEQICRTRRVDANLLAEPW